MSGPTTSAWELEIEGPTKTFGVMIRRPDGNADAPPTLPDVLVAQTSDQPFSEQLAPVVKEDFSGGMGVDYDQAPGVFTRARGTIDPETRQRTGGYAMPAGAPTAIQVPVGGNSASPINSIEEYGRTASAAGDIFFGQYGTAGTAGRVFKSIGGTGTGGGTPTASLTVAVGQYVWSLCAFEDAAGVPCLYASSSDVNGANGFLYQYNPAAYAAPGWSAGVAFGARGMRRLAKVYWVGNDGIGAWRLVAIQSNNTIGYTVPGGDPLNTATGWVHDVRISTNTYLWELVSSGRHLYVLAPDSVFDFTSLGESPSLTPYWGQQVQYGNGECGIVFEGYLYAGLGRGIDRVYVDREGIKQERPGICSPGWGTRAENDVRGWCTAMTTDQGYLVAAIHNNTLGKSYICWGKDREQFEGGVDTANPLVWYGPEVFFDLNYRVTRMRTASPAEGDLRLWVAAQSLPGGNPYLASVSLPIAGNPLQDLTSGGAHRYATGSGSGVVTPYCRLDLLPMNFGDKNSTKILHQLAFGTRGLEATTPTKITVYSRADPAPGSATWGSGTDVTTNPSTTITPTSPTRGNSVQLRIDFVSPSGTATPAKVGLLDACRMTAWKVTPSFSVWSLTVEYGPDVANRYNEQGTSYEVSQIADWIQETIAAPLAVLRDPTGKRWNVKFNQYFNQKTTYDREGGAVRAVADLQVVRLSAA